MFEDSSLEATKEDVFEQIVGFTLSEGYTVSKGLVKLLMEEAKFVLDAQ